MGLLDNLMAKPIDVEIGGQKMTLKALPMSKLPLVLKMSNKNPEEQAKVINELVKATLKQSYPELTDESIESISVEHFQSFVEAILKVNGLEGKADVPASATA